mgnify:FL=1
MTINVTTLEANLTTKINATTGTTDGKEFLLLSKAVEAVNTAVANNSLAVANNLSDLTDAAAARTNLGVADYLSTTSAAATYAALSGATFTGAVIATDLTLSGNLTVNGTTTTVNSTTLDVADKNITIAAGAADAATANGAGISVDGAGANITYTSSTDTWDFNKAISGTYTNLQPEVTTTSAAATSQTFDMNEPMTHMTMTAATTFTAINLAAGKTAMMVLDTTATAYTPSWVSDIKWPADTEPSWADSRYWVISFTCLNGTTTLASASGYTV